MTLIVVIVIVLVIGAAIVFAISRGVQTDAVAVAADKPSPAYDDEGEAVLIERDPEITWPSLFAPESKDLDGAARLRLINDLALVRAPWCIPILRKACEEEREPALRQAAHDAVAACETAVASIQ
jgi:hypothetical protein